MVFHFFGWPLHLYVLLMTLHCNSRVSHFFQYRYQILTITPHGYTHSFKQTLSCSFQLDWIVIFRAQATQFQDYIIPVNHCSTWILNLKGWTISHLGFNTRYTFEWCLGEIIFCCIHIYYNKNDYQKWGSLLDSREVYYDIQ